MPDDREEVPGGADAYLLRHILHDRNDDRADLILKNIHQAILERSRRLVIETVTRIVPTVTDVNMIEGEQGGGG